jgi:hypothetical protein
VGIRRASFVLAFVLAGAACADLGGLAGDSGLGPIAPQDAGRDRNVPGPSADGSPPGVTGRCNPANPFSPPELMVSFDATTDNVKGAVLSPDELEVFYLRYVNATSNWELRHARRAAREDDFGAIETTPMSPTPDGFLSLSANGLKLYYWTIDQNFRATRAGSNQVFGTPSSFDVKSGPAPFVVAADDTAYFSVYQASDAGGVSQDKVIKQGTLRTSGFSSISSPVANIHVAGTYDSVPVLDVTERVLYFASNRPGGKGLADVWVARRASKQLDFGAPLHVPELSTDLPDQVTWVSEDECEVFLDRSSHIYRARRPL